jgi:Transposase IS116/IS110/IS902 family
LNETSKRLDAIPGVGPALATALVATIGDPKAFRSGRDFSAWIGLVPKQNSSGGKDKLGNISKQGDRYLRSLFTAGALTVIRYAKLHGTKHRPVTQPNRSSATRPIDNYLGGFFLHWLSVPFGAHQLSGDKLPPPSRASSTISDGAVELTGGNRLI